MTENQMKDSHIPLVSFETYERLTEEWLSMSMVDAPSSIREDWAAVEEALLTGIGRFPRGVYDWYLVGDFHNARTHGLALLSKSFVRPAVLKAVRKTIGESVRDCLVKVVIEDVDKIPDVLIVLSKNDRYTCATYLTQKGGWERHKALVLGSPELRTLGIVDAAAEGRREKS